MDGVVVLGRSSTRRHSCKVCRKGFPCGRSLGGHMRSHSLAEVAVADEEDDGDADADDDEEDEHERGARASFLGSGGGGYGLRENPKKTRRLSGLDGGDEVDGGSECHDDRGELFSSCHPVLGHVRRHAPEERAYADGENVGVEVAAKREDEEGDMVMIPSEAAVLMPAPRRRRRTMRVPAPALPSAAARDAFDKEPEDAALCLIMLSRDTTVRCVSTAKDAEHSAEKDRKGRDGAARFGYYHDAHSDDASALFRYADVDITKSKKRKTGPSFAGEEKRGRYECPGCGRAFQSYQALGGHRASHKRINSSCCIAKVATDQPEPSVETNNSFSTASAPASPDVDADRAVVAVKSKKVTKFECPICFKVFGSGQALGGHKRSHSIAGELYERTNANGDAGIVEPEQSLIAARFLDLNLPAPAAED
ncbi:zinc finger protein ZAT4-like [Phragmites australis]|uniref:zinc finger protein ZAT4-like n=1 Tax=Phragmites australis TaxID=29695 RepID=UPI002D765DEF|nr:zinc finger protein ZAT4-like [Phragmites australis]